MRPEPGSGVSQPLWGVKVLLIADGVGRSGATQRLLEDEGACVAVVSNGSAALDVIETVNPDVVLCDVRMSAMDVEFPRRLRADVRFARFARLPLIALTALGGSTEYLRTLRANFDGHLLKPVGAVTLIAVVHHLSRRSRRRVGRFSPSDHPTDRLAASSYRHAA